jgi:Xaa-Pro aminopeptidase
MSPLISQRLTDKAFQVYDAEPIIEQAKLIKCELEIDCLKHSIQVAQYGMQLMYQALRPGITENQLWSIMHQVNAAHGGDWIEGNMLASGPRTNPWLQEASHRIIEKGDMVAFDTDMIGPLGYIADISRSWVCGGGKGNQAQRDAYRHAYDEVHHNMQLIKPGISFRELSEQAFIRKAEYRDNRYVCSFHGAGLSDEYPKIYYQEDWARSGYDGLVQENMVLCVESYSGIKGGSVGVKLEEMVRVTSKGITPLTDFPFEDELLNDSYLT